MAGQHNLSIDAGSTWLRNIFWYDGAAAVDITGYTASLKMKREHGAATLDYELSTANGRISITGAEGKIALALTDEQTASLSDTYVYDLVVSDAGVDTRLLQGKITISPEVGG